MLQLPYEYEWGVDVAIKKLRPAAIFQLEGTRFTYWEDSIENSEPPTWEEVMNQLEEDRLRAEKWMEENQQS